MAWWLSTIASMATRLVTKSCASDFLLVYFYIVICDTVVVKTNCRTSDTKPKKLLLLVSYFYFLLWCYTHWLSRRKPSIPHCTAQCIASICFALHHIHNMIFTKHALNWHSVIFKELFNIFTHISPKLVSKCLPDMMSSILPPKMAWCRADNKALPVSMMKVSTSHVSMRIIIR